MRKFNRHEVLVEWDDVYECWGVFCEETGFCLGQFATEDDANAYVRANS